jgi:serine/threonine-protein kinase RsbW
VTLDRRFLRAATRSAIQVAQSTPATQAEMTGYPPYYARQGEGSMRRYAVTAAAPGTYARAFSGHADQVREARRFLADTLDGHPAASDAVLCLSELAANAVLHSLSRQPGGQFTVSVRLGYADRFRVEVEDEGGPWTRVNANGEHGRGLFIVSQLARDWGISEDSRATGRTVWFEIDAY